MRFRRSSSDHVIAGVCGAIGQRLGIDPLWVRLVFVFGSGAFFWVYLALWALTPLDNE
ncbi:PspC domain-containing protein [Lacticaseibacillus mingshuiensis]|uniref:PspC domain-containing protein n=1 Tax=Lacticaseibacillus mingshuiensis TaxID=2799574 RepID=UPI0019501FFD|nr:PspC domain-containing protein [Lacticaseibacillus mingshuiensis]